MREVRKWWPWGKNDKPIRQPQLMEGQDGYVFRRSRTLTGTSSSQVTATAENRGQLKTDRIKLHELRTHRRLIMQMLAVVLGVVAVLALLLLNFITTPVFTFAQPNAKHEPQTALYKDTFYKYFADHPLERFGFALNAGSLEAYIKRVHTEIQSVSVQRAWYGGEAQFGLFFRQPLLVWQTGNKKFYVDNNGIAFTYNHFAEPAVSVTDQSGIPPDQNSTVASTRFIRFLGRMVGAVNSYKKGDVTTVIIPASTREIDLKLHGRDYLIRTQIDRDPLQQAEDLANALAYFDQKNIKPAYVDVRVEHRAFYKD